MFFPVTLAFLVAVSLTPLLASWARNRNLLDVPNERSSHAVATPRTGGTAFAVAVLAGVAASLAGGSAPGERGVLVLAAAVAIAVLGLIDDLRSLPAWLRLLVQSGTAVLLVFALGSAPFPSIVPGWAAAGVTVLWMVALTNAYNFMDGIDGIAGIQAIVAGLGWVVIGAIAGLADAVVLGLLLTAGVAGFLVYNWPPARVFMGDAGSGFLGFSFAAIPLIAPEHGPHLLLSAALLTWPFLFDTSFTLIRRVRRRENIFAAHRTHLYQRLTVTGLSHARVTALYGVLGVLGAGGAIALATAPPGVALLPAVVVPVSAFALWRYVVSREFLSSREPSLPAALPR